MIVVVIDEPREHHYGGVVAAPVFQRIAESSLDYLHVHREPVLAQRRRAGAARSRCCLRFPRPPP